MKVCIFVTLIACAFASRAHDVVPSVFTGDVTTSGTTGTASGTMGVDLPNQRGYIKVNGPQGPQEVYFQCGGASSTKLFLQGSDCVKLPLPPQECLQELAQFDFYAHGDQINLGGIKIVYDVTNSSASISAHSGQITMLTKISNYREYTDEPLTCSSTKTMSRRQLEDHTMIKSNEKAGCNKLLCAGKIIACAAVCIGSLGTACLTCLGGASGCLSCF